MSTATFTYRFQSEVNSLGAISIPLLPELHGKQVEVVVVPYKINGIEEPTDMPDGYDPRLCRFVNPRAFSKHLIKDGVDIVNFSTCSECDVRGKPQA